MLIYIIYKVLDLQMIDNTYAGAIKKLRTKLTITQEEFAQYMGVTFVTVNRWENGKAEPTTKAKRRLQELFKNNGIVF